MTASILNTDVVFTYELRSMLYQDSNLPKCQRMVVLPVIVPLNVIGLCKMQEIWQPSSVKSAYILRQPMPIEVILA